MCLIFFSINNHPAYKLIVAANRDEFYQRKSAPADYWEDHPHVLGGRDLEAQGTWLAMSSSGKIAMVTNFRDPKNLKAHAPSRGHLVSDYVVGPVDPEHYLRQIEPVASRYNGFNLLVGYTETMWYLSNYGQGIRKITDGLYGLSNHLLDTPWPKVVKGKNKMTGVLQQAHIRPEELFDLLYDDETAADHLLPDTGVGLERERALSSMFIKSPGYGTRSSTVVLVDRENRVQFVERVYDLTTFGFSERSFTFTIQTEPAI